MRQALLLLFFAPSLFAQSPAPKDPDIVWAAEIEQDWVIDIPSLEDEWNQGVFTLKQLRSRNNELNWSSPYFAELVMEAVQSGKLAVFKDPGCGTLAGDYLDYRGADTIVVFDPVTYDEQVLTVRNPLQPLVDIKAWRLRQVLSYHKKSATWSTTVVALAPLVTIYGIEGDSLDTRPLFWFKPENKSYKLGNERISWAKKTFSGKQAGTEIPANPIKQIKVVPGFENPMAHQLNKLETDRKSTFYDSQGNERLSPEARREMLSKTDTITTFDPETFEEIVHVVPAGIKVGDVNQLRLVQTWYWDARKSRLSIHLDAVAPIEDVYDVRGNFRYPKPLFYRLANR